MDEKQVYVLPLIPLSMGQDIVCRMRRKMNVYKHIYNRLVSYINKAISDNEEALRKYWAKEIKIYELLDSITISYNYNGKEKYFGLKEYAFIAAVNHMLKESDGSGKFNEIVSTANVRNISRELAKAVKTLLEDCKENEIPKLKYKEECNSITFQKNSGTTNKFSGITLDKEHGKLTLSKNEGGGEAHFTINQKHDYELMAIGDEVHQITITRKNIRGKEKWYVYFTLGGLPYMKNRNIGSGTVSIDIGPSAIYVLKRDENGEFSKHEYDLSDISTITGNENGKEAILSYYKKERRLNRAMDRSRRATNPDKYNEDGTFNRKNKNLPWHRSKAYVGLKDKLNNTSRKKTAHKEIVENLVINEIVGLGDTFKIEYSPGMIKSWCARDKETKTNKNGKFLSKKNFGRTVMNSAPYRFVTKLERKVKQLGGHIYEIPTHFGSTGFDHTAVGTDKEYVKHKLSERTVTLSNGNKHSRDFHSCFNIMFAKEPVGKKRAENKRDNYNVKEMVENYPNFCKCDVA